jgi:hypothetical protein
MPITLPGSEHCGYRGYCGYYRYCDTVDILDIVDIVYIVDATIRPMLNFTPYKKKILI